MNNLNNGEEVKSPILQSNTVDHSDSSVFGTEDESRLRDTAHDIDELIGMGKRKVLVVEDVELNREILANILSDDYEVITAENGKIGLELLEEHYRDLSIVLLDMYMPVCDGFEFLRRSREDALLASVPVMVTTGSAGAQDEVRCLELGASDFITKPYNARVVLSRIKSIIKLRESDITLASIEYDDSTGLYTGPAFKHYAEKLLKASGSDPVALVVTEIENLSQIEATSGIRYAEEIVRFYAEEFKKLAPGSIAYRKDNQFYFMLKHEGSDPSECIAAAREIEKKSQYSGLNIKYGFYYNVDKTVSITELCDRVRLTVSSIRGTFITNYAVYNNEIAKQQEEKYHIESGFDAAVSNEEFVIYLQPKYDVISGRIESAEALVRWKKPDGSMVSPGAFIPVYEEDGLIVRLDEYVFRKVCSMQKARIAAGLPVTRISINLSRMTLINENVSAKYSAIVKEYDIPFDAISIELTESFAMENTKVAKLAEGLVDSGFRLDMDDFGSGYSSMSGLVSLPFSVIKLDKSLTDRIGDRRGEIIIEYAIVIAHKLNMTVVAEGVEEEAQADFLKTVNCDAIQGFYYSRPLPAEDFNKLLEKEDR